jgi:hypothetical protein
MVRPSASSLLLAGVLLLVALGGVLWSFAPAAPLPEPSGIEPPSSAALSEESRYLEELRTQTDPRKALEMAEEGHQRFQQGGHYADREVIVIRSMMRLGKREEAQGRARLFLRRFPGHPQAELVRRMAGL